MKYVMGETKTLPLIIPNNAIVTSFKLAAALHKYKERKKEYPFRITWKLRVSNEKVHVFSFLGDSAFALIYDEIPLDVEELDRLVKSMYFNFGLQWEEKTIGTILQGNPAPPLKTSSLLQ